MKLVIPGGTGQIGTLLARHFHAAGHEVVVLSRTPAAVPVPWRVAAWDAETVGSWSAELDGANAVVNLAGRSVNCRYSAANRKLIRDSRVNSTRAVGAAVRTCTRPPRVWLQMSTATIYAHTLGPAHDEATGVVGGAEPGVPDTWRFSTDVATSWEAAANTDTPATRKVLLRTAMVMSPDRGGVFDVLSGLVRKGLGGRAGAGDQFVSWIHGDDFCRAVEWLIDPSAPSAGEKGPTRNRSGTELSGPVNVCAPNPLPNAEFMRALRRAWGVRVGLPATRWMLELGAFAMRTETELVLKSRRVVPGKLLASGFEFRYPEWPAAAADLATRKSAG